MTRSSCSPTRSSRGGRIGAVSLAAAGVLLLLACPAASLAAEPAATQVAAHLAAGEFGPALAVARGAPVAERDLLVGQVAQAQARAGNHAAARQTSGSLADSDSRHAALAQLRTSPPAFGGGSAADFDTLIDLITSTISPTTWDDVGGPGAIDAFPGGVYVDAAGTLRTITVSPGALGDLRATSALHGANRDARRASKLRKISLTRLERAVELRWAAGKGPDETMQNLAGLARVKYLLIYPESGDLVLAGPAGDWRPDAEERSISTEHGRPVVQLDDLVVLLRNAWLPEPRFGCSITPTRDALAGAKTYLEETSKQPLKAGTGPRWLAGLRDRLGQQEIEVYGIDPRTRAARVIVEADYRMKLVGMGLEEGGPNVPSYLSAVKLAPDGALPPMNVLRWWFTLNYDGISTTGPRDAFAFRGAGVKVLSENELLTERGERVHTGRSDEPNSEFARNFTRNFDSLAVKQPVYADLQNLFDLALVAGVCRSEDLPGRVDWGMRHFGPEGAYEPHLGAAPKRVETVANLRTIGGRHIVAGVSGGVTVDPRDLTKRAAVRVEQAGPLGADRANSVRPQIAEERWWWD